MGSTSAGHRVRSSNPFCTSCKHARHSRLPTYNETGMTTGRDGPNRSQYLLDLRQLRGGFGDQLWAMRVVSWFAERAGMSAHSVWFREAQRSWNAPLPVLDRLGLSNFITNAKALCPLGDQRKLLRLDGVPPAELLPLLRRAGAAGSASQLPTIHQLVLSLPYLIALESHCADANEDIGCSQLMTDIYDRMKQALLQSGRLRTNRVTLLFHWRLGDTICIPFRGRFISAWGRRDKPIQPPETPEWVDSPEQCRRLQLSLGRITSVFDSLRQSQADGPSYRTVLMTDGYDRGIATILRCKDKLGLTDAEARAILDLKQDLATELMLAGGRSFDRVLYGESDDHFVEAIAEIIQATGLVSPSGQFVFQILRSFSGCNARFFVGNLARMRAPLSERCLTDRLNLATIHRQQGDDTLRDLLERGLRYAQQPAGSGG